MKTSQQQGCHPALQSDYDRVAFLMKQDSTFVRDAFDLIVNFAENFRDFAEPEGYLDLLFDGYITSQDYIEHPNKKMLVEHYRNLKTSLQLLEGFFDQYALSGYNYFDQPWSKSQQNENTDYIANKTDYNELNPLP